MLEQARRPVAGNNPEMGRRDTQPRVTRDTGPVSTWENTKLGMEPAYKDSEELLDKNELPGTKCSVLLLEFSGV